MYQHVIHIISSLDYSHTTLYVLDPQVFADVSGQSFLKAARGDVDGPHGWNIQYHGRLVGRCGNIWLAIVMPKYNLPLVLFSGLTHWDRNKMAATFQTIFSNTYSWMKIYEIGLRFHWSLFLRVQLTIFQHWFRYWLGADQATGHYLNQWWIIYRRIYASLGLNKLTALTAIRVSHFYRRKRYTPSAFYQINSG